MPQEQIGANLHVKFGLLFDQLGIARHPLAGRPLRRSRAALPRPLPAALGGGAAKAVAAGASVFEDDGSGE